MTGNVINTDYCHINSLGNYVLNCMKKLVND